MAAPSASRFVPRLLLAAIVAFSLWSHLYGIRGDLPWAWASDEGESALVAVSMAAAGDPNPHWFGHPGSTFFYPLAALFHVANAIDAGRSPLHADPKIGDRIGGDLGRYFLLGRLLVVLFAVASLPLVYAIGRLAYDDTTAVVATWLAVLSPLTLEHAQMLRTDSAGLFFGLLALWLCLRVLERPGGGAHVLAGLALGAAIGTRYFLVTLVPLLPIVDAVLAWRAPAGSAERRRLLGAGLLGLACVAIGFCATTPFFFLEFATAWQNLAHETRSEHLGADGLGMAGNLRWYLTDALPASLPRAPLLLAALGAVVAAWRRNVAALLIVVAIALFLLAISSAALHWQRWVIQILPLLSLLAAGALLEVVRGIARRLGARPATEVALVVGATVLLSAGPALAYVGFSLAQGKPSTRIAAREWMVANLAPGSRIAADFYSAPLQETQLPADYHFSLAADGSLKDYRGAGYDYLMVSDAIYGRYQQEPRRYAKELGFYQELFRTARPVMRFTPREVGRGPTITVFALAAPAS